MIFEAVFGFTDPVRTFPKLRFIRSSQSKVLSFLLQKDLVHLIDPTVSIGLIGFDAGFLCRFNAPRLVS